MIDASKNNSTASATVSTNKGTPQSPPAAYVPPAATNLGNLEQVQAYYRTGYYDGTGTVWCRA